MISENHISSIKDIKYLTQQVIDKLHNTEIICAKKLTAKCKQAKAYFYTGGGYDIETTTIKHKEVLIGNTRYISNGNGTYQFNNGNVIVNENIPENSIRYVVPEYAFSYHQQLMVAGMYFTFREQELVALFLKYLSHEIKHQIGEYHKKTGFPKIILWVANLNHEWTYLMSYINDKDVTSYFAKDTTTPLQITLFDVFELRECIGLFGYSLDNIAKNYTKTQKLKGDLDYDKIRHTKTPLTEKEKEYCYNDVKILDELSYYAHDAFTKQGRDIPLTQTGMVRQDCKKALGNKKHLVEKDNFKLIPYHENTEKSTESEKLYFEWRRYLYQGGYSHGNAKYIGKLLHDVKCADVTSDYPYQMNHHYFPSGEIKKADKSQYKDLLKSTKCLIIKVLYKKLQARSTHTLISKNKVVNISETNNCIWDNGRLYRGNNIILWCSEIDLKCISSMYEGSFNILEMWYFTKRKSIPNYIKNTMNNYYSKKNHLKKMKLDKTIEYVISKQKTNSVYGMTGTQIYQRTTELINGEFKTKDVDDFNFMEEINKLWLNPYIAYWTTAYARMLLVNYICKYPDIIVQYDTDSLYYITDTNVVDAKDVELFEKDLETHNRKIETENQFLFNDKNMWDLGTWEIDKPYMNFKTLGAKRYLCETYPDNDGKTGIKPVIAGCPKTAFIEYCEKTNTNPFEFFENNMTLSQIYSKKLTTAYRRDKTPVKVTITDYTGITEDVEYRSYCALYEIPFKLTMEKQWLNSLDIIIDYDKKYPFRYRKNAQLEDLIYQR